MTDNELLELAAKAAGKTNWQSRYCYSDGRCDSEGVPYWNPLADDGDALRLAVKLGLDIAIFDKESVNSGMWSSDHNKQWPSPVEFGDDPYAATRRAIVRAAAEIGGSLK